MSILYLEAKTILEVGADAIVIIKIVNTKLICSRWKFDFMQARGAAALFF